MSRNFSREKNEVNTHIDRLVSECVQSYKANYNKERIKDAESFVAYNISSLTISIAYISANLFNDYKRCLGAGNASKLGTEKFIEELYLKQYGDYIEMISYMNDFLSVIVRRGYKIYSKNIEDEIRKANRGKFIGGGFGIDGTIKGMITANILNGISTVGYSYINQVKASYRETRLMLDIEKVISQGKKDLPDVLKSDLNLFKNLNEVSFGFFETEF